ncbi:hypothetical protein CANARDRAFT_203716 [[Candida] arabinofermentans NRRL YB-2248]|uniref:Uncharacterized protein n=1 Tax=[Candida] arabinofermentans NRRL YB-2248 TaxID=983967 RepID=A0A1E4SUC7_9ASCO|nr:hypothetical protein CANARDRAFT_203716 [[Candida] arabinofermentans NRRL YB-2248]
MDVNLLRIDTEPNWKDNYETLLQGPYKYLADQTKGKHLRSLLIKTFNLIFGVEDEKLNQLDSIINILHLSSLIIDDIEDSSNLRRGKPCSHLIFGVPQAINTSNYMYFISMQLLTKTFNQDSNQQLQAQSIFVEEMINLHRGQGLDLYWRDMGKCPDETEYLDMVMNKTGGLFRLSIKLLSLMARINNLDKLIELSNLLGVIYQIKDDFMNLKSEILTENKGFCEDITEGKFSFPIIHSINSDIGNTELLNILRLKTEDLDLKTHALEIMERTGSFEYCIKTIDNLKCKGLELIESIIDEYVDGQHKKCLVRNAFLKTLNKITNL